MYEGFLMPDGNIPSAELILNNGKMNQDLERRWMNEISYLSYLYRLMDYAMSAFEWHDLPKGVDARMLEYWLLQYGMVAFFYDKTLVGSRNAPEGYAVLPVMISGEWDMYNYPVQRTAYTTQGANYQLDESNSVLIFNSYLRTPMLPTLKWYAKRLGNLDRTLDVNIEQQKTPKILRGDQAQKLTLTNMMQQVQENALWIWWYKGMEMSDAIEVLDTTAPFVSKDLQTVKHQIWNEALTYIGIENVNTEKKERLVTDEVMSNMGDVEISRFTRLNSRNKSCDEIGDLFGLTPSVTFRSGSYIKAEGYASQPIPVAGMTTGAAGTPASGYEDKGTIMDRWMREAQR
jgi:hypothetical protein